MQIIRHMEQDKASLVGWGVKVLLLAPDYGDRDGKVAVRIAGLGGIVDQETDFYSAIEALEGATSGYGLVIMEADAFGGLEEARRLIAELRRTDARIPVILVSSECHTQTFPSDDRLPVELRAPLSSVSLRVGFEHAMRHRLVFQAA